MSILNTSLDTPTATSKEVMTLLEKIYQVEMAGICRYLHYSFMIMGYNRIPIQKWFRDNAVESMDHAVIIGEKITAYGGHPPLLAPDVEESNSHQINDILAEVVTHERYALSLYKDLVKVVGDDVALEELARDFVMKETQHVEEVQKMLRQPLVKR